MSINISRFLLKFILRVYNLVIIALVSVTQFPPPDLAASAAELGGFNRLHAPPPLFRLR